MKKEFTIQVKNDGEGKQIVSARDLHEYLGVGRDFTTWIKERIEKYQFEENTDFTIVSIAPQNGGTKRGGHNKVDYVLRLDMAKELSMIENNDRGREARKYFIECEKKLFDVSKYLKESQDDFSKLLDEAKGMTDLDWALDRSIKNLEKVRKRDKIILALHERNKKDLNENKILAEFKTRYAMSNFMEFKSIDTKNEKRECISELEIEKENLEEMKRLGINKDDALNDIVENKTLENTVKILGQQKLTTKE